MAVGRLGSAEFDVLSDADILFVSGEDEDRPALTKPPSRSCRRWPPTPATAWCFPWMRACDPAAAKANCWSPRRSWSTYFKQEAQPWEALMYTKLRFLAGSRTLAERAAGSDPGSIPPLLDR